MYYIKTIWNLPALIFHECCHLIVSGLLFVSITKLEYYFFGKEENDKEIIYKGCGINIFYSKKTSKWKLVLIAIAPLIGVNLLFWTMVFIGNVFSILIISYVISCLNIFVPSKQDFNILKYVLKIK